MRTSADRTAWWLLAGFGLLYLAIWVPNHLLFRTYALDLGLYTHALWQYAHGKLADTALFLNERHPLLADHFDLYLPLLSPLVRVFGSWTLLLVQWSAMLFGAWGVRRCLLLLGVGKGPATVAMVVMLTFFGMFTSAAFDYHSNVVGAMLLPWWLASLVQGRPWSSLLWLLLMVAGKENMGLWVGWVALLLAAAGPIPTAMRKWAVVGTVFAWGWSVVVIALVMPAMATAGEYAHFDYSILGSGLQTVVPSFVERPGSVLAALFTDHVGVPQGTALKLEFWWLLLLAGGWAFLVRPSWGLMAIPLVAQKMLHDDPGKWSVAAHYGAEFAPLIGMACGLVLLKWPRRWLAAITVLAAMGATVRCMDNTVAFQDRARMRIYQAQHWRRDHPVRDVRDALALVPDHASLSAQSPAVPHAIGRMDLYQFPLGLDADLILLLPTETTYPMDTAAYRQLTTVLRNDPQWTVRVDKPHVLLLQRN